jgi:hypothetical protein
VPRASTPRADASGSLGEREKKVFFLQNEKKAKNTQMNTMVISALALVKEMWSGWPQGKQK